LYIDESLLNLGDVDRDRLLWPTAHKKLQLIAAAADDLPTPASVRPL
jgi:hypothetical protein